MVYLYKNTCHLPVVKNGASPQGLSDKAQSKRMGDAPSPPGDGGDLLHAPPVPQVAPLQSPILPEEKRHLPFLFRMQ